MMTDEEILKRLAEIEGMEPLYTDPSRSHFFASPNILGAPWNPLTNWSDLGPLIEKYYPTIMKIAAIGIPGKDDFQEVDYWSAYAGGKEVDHESLPHAICLAIIEANK